MPDYEQRPQFEVALAKAIDEPFAAARDQYSRDGSIDLDSFESKLRANTQPELERSFAAVYLFMMDDPSIANSGVVNTAPEMISRNWSSATSQRLARAVTERSRAMLSTGAAIDKIFSSSRVMSIAITETTRTISAAETEARAAAAGITGGQPRTVSLQTSFDSGQAVAPLEIPDGVIAIWWTENDGRVCDICRPLHKRTYNTWVNVAPFGPPAHPRCRCYIEYRVISESLFCRLGRFSALFRDAVANAAAYLRRL